MNKREQQFYLEEAIKSSDSEMLIAAIEAYQETKSDEDAIDVAEELIKKLDMYALLEKHI